MNTNPKLSIVVGIALLLSAIALSALNIQRQDKLAKRVSDLEATLATEKLQRGDPTTAPPDRYFTVEKVLDENHFVTFVGGDIYSDEYKLYKLSKHGFVEKKSYVPTAGGNSAPVPHFRQVN